MTTPFNPLDMENLAQSVVSRMEETEATPLGELSPFLGAGVYEIYYRGPFNAYEPLSKHNQEAWTAPIYVGKAVPAGGRRGLETLNHDSSNALFKRIREHANSIRAAQNLDINDFAVRWLVVQDIWIALGESALIRRYTPVWNSLLDGFGNHDPGSGRINGVRTRWDTLHPGRPFAPKFPARDETPAQIEQDVIEYLRSRL
ncbi:Eco29kI family restriction endonuclease [Nocardia sp. NPDC049190]|uniref:Eco29kI family restriction endonuclease n=1 Tax=Nocardia sp. NPDC049190 TaxID=3155650 RepID=UPI00340753E1